MSGSIALRLRSPTKSLAVKKFTIISERDAYSPISSDGRSVHGSNTGGKIFRITNIITAATAPVTTKVPTVVPIIFPARPLLLIPAIELEIEANTKGTTTQNIMLMKIVPSGLIAIPNDGANQPTIQPRIIAPSIIARKR